jgi:hypothetical protein
LRLGITEHAERNTEHTEPDLRSGFALTQKALLEPHVRALGDR